MMPEIQAMAKASSPKRSGVVVPHPVRWHQRLAAILLYGLARIVSATIRYEWQDRTGTLSRDMNRPVIFCIWHNRLALCLEVYRFYLNSIGRHCRMAAMVSASKDGGLFAFGRSPFQVDHGFRERPSYRAEQKKSGK